MGKNIIVALFLIMVGAALFIFIQRQPESRLLDKDKESAKGSPRIYLEEFIVYDYERHKPMTTLSGNSATFVDPNKLEMFGNIQGHKLDSTRKEFFSGESASITFAAKGLSDMVKTTRIQSSEIKTQVRFGYDGNILYTEYAKYLNDQEQLMSDQPVRILGPQIDLNASKGFEYQTKTRDLKVFGPLEGTLIGTDEQPK